MSFLYNTIDDSGSAGPTIVDSFEDQDIAEYGGNTDGYEIVTSNATDGQYALSNGTSFSGTRVIQSTTGLDNYISQGDTARFDWHLTETDAATGLLLFTQDETATPSGYFIRPNDVDDTFQIYRVDSGSFNLLDEVTGLSLSQGTTYTVEIRPDSNGIDADLIEAGSVIASVTTTDTNYTSGGIGFRAGGQTVATVDYVRIL